MGRADDFGVPARSYLLTLETPAKGGGVHAALVTLTIDPAQAPAAASALVNEILPTVRSAPGFVAGYWLEPADGQGFSIVLFESEEEARQTAPPLGNWAPRASPSKLSSSDAWPPPPERVRLAELTQSAGAR
jgi:hypothetical protein